MFSWDAAWQRRGPEYAGSESPGSIEIDKAVIEDAKSHGKGYMMGLSPLQYKSAVSSFRARLCSIADALQYYTNVYRPGELALPKRMENILNMAQRPDYVCVITWVGHSAVRPHTFTHTTAERRPRKPLHRQHLA